MKIKLKSCPFCGAKAKLVNRGRKYKCKWAIGCTNQFCFSSVWLPENVDLEILHNYLMCFRYKKECISYWNRRF